MHACTKILKIKKPALLGLALCFLLPTARAAEYSAESYMQEGFRLDKRREYFQASRYYFQALQKTDDANEKAMAYARMANSLANERLYQSASYFFLKAISSGDARSIKVALQVAKPLIDNVGGVIFKKYILKYTRDELYTARDQRDYFLYYLAQDHLFGLRPHEVIRVVGDIQTSFENYPYAMFLRGSAHLMANMVDQGIADFKKCVEFSTQSRYTKNSMPEEVREIRNRCIAGVARAEYQARRYVEADLWYDQIEIDSFVWPQVQYERAWTSVAKGDYNRALGRLVTYKAPALSWFKDSEVEMLRALSYLQMCIYDDVDKEATQFVNTYGPLGSDVKRILQNSADGSTRGLVNLFSRGTAALRSKVQTESSLTQMMNKFVHSPYFVQLANTGEKVRKEVNYLNTLGKPGRIGLGGFLRDVLVWRWQSAQEIGGLFVRDRLDTEYKALLGNISTMDVVKLEMLRRAKSRIERVGVNEGTDIWGVSKRGSLGRPKIRDDQYFWDFNGEFWADELGDYVFALRPECY